MQTKLEAFENEIETLKRMINGYISTNPELMNLKVTSLGLSPIDRQEALIHDKGKNIAENASCKICRDRDGNLYCYYGTGPCPTFNNNGD